MAEPDRKVRKAKINKENLKELLLKIGVFTFPKSNAGNKVGPVARLGPACTGYLTSARCVDTSRSRFKSLHTYRSRLEASKQERLFVPQETKLPGKSVTEDIDPELFTVVGGRPVRERGGLQDHVAAVRSCFLTRLQTTSLQQLQRHWEEERREAALLLDRGKASVAEQLQLFDQFLQEDYQSSAEWLARAEAASKETASQEEKVAELTRELESVLSRVVVLEEQWRYCKMLQQFLYSVAPLQWRRIHDYIHNKPAQANECSLFRRLRGPSLTTKDPLSSKIARFMGEAEGGGPALFFSEPQQLFEMLRELEVRNLGSLLQCERLQPAILTMQTAWKEAEVSFEKEKIALQQDVAELERVVAAEEQQAERLRAEALAVGRQRLRALMSDARTVHINACLEHAYEQVVGPNDSGLGPLAMMRALQTTHEMLRLQQDILPSALVKAVSSSWEREERRVMREAKAAAKKVHQMEMLEKRLRSALRPWTSVSPSRRLVSRSHPPMEAVEKAKPPAQLTAQQLEYLNLFGEPEQADVQPDRMYRPLC